MAEEQGTTEEVKGVVEPTEPTKEPTDITKTPEYQKAVSTGVSKGLESIQKQLDIRKGEADSAQSLVAQFEASKKSTDDYIGTLKGEMEGLARTNEDPDLLKSYKSRIVIAEKEMKATEKDIKATQKMAKAEDLAKAATMSTLANELVKSSGIPMSELRTCETSSDMEIKALKFQLANQSAPKVEPKGDPPKFTGAGGGGSKEGPASSRERIRGGWDKIHK